MGKKASIAQHSGKLLGNNEVNAQDMGGARALLRRRDSNSGGFDLDGVELLEAVRV